jgi:recombination protein RecA
MAKTKLAKSDSGALAEIAKKYGNVIKTGTELLEKRKDYKIITVSPVVDVALSGGIKEGSWVMLSGAAKSGKTTLAMQIAANCQKEGRHIIYLDVEGRLKEMNFEVAELDPNKVTIIRAEEEPLSAEKFLDIAYKLVSSKENEGCVCIIDSISSLIPQRDLEQDINGMTRPGLPKILSDFTKKMGQIVPNQRALMILITHMITNTSGYGASKMADGGVKIQYQADTRMEVKSIQPWVQDDQQIGQAINWKVLCSSMGPPGAECQSWVRYGHGVDKIQEILIMGQEAGLISQAGAWMTCSFLYNKPELLKSIFSEVELNSDNTYKNPDEALKKCKCQGAEKLYFFIKENPSLYDALVEEIKSML